MLLKHFFLNTPISGHWRSAIWALALLSAMSLTYLPERPSNLVLTLMLGTGLAGLASWYRCTRVAVDTNTLDLDSLGLTLLGAAASVPVAAALAFLSFS